MLLLRARAMASPGPAAGMQQKLEAAAAAAGGGDGAEWGRGMQKMEAVGAGGEGVGAGAEQVAPPPRRPVAARKERVCTAKERISRMPPCAAGKRSSIYRGVTRYGSSPLCPLPPPCLESRRSFTWMLIRGYAIVLCLD